MDFYSAKRFETVVTQDPELADAMWALLMTKYRGNDTVLMERTTNGQGDILLKVESTILMERVPVINPELIIE